MKKILLFPIVCMFALSANAQLRVTSDGSTLFPCGTRIETGSGNIYLPGSNDIRFGSDYSFNNNATWAIEYYGGGLNIWKPNGSTNAGDYKMFLADNGKIGIGAGNAPQANLHVKNYNFRLSPSNSEAEYEVVVGNADPRIKSSSAKLVFYKLDNSGFANIQCGTMTQSSDSTLKTNIKKIEKDYALNAVCKLQGHTYNWKTDEKGIMESGLIAQEVEKVLPHLISNDNDTTHIKTMSYIGLIPYLIEAIKAQQAEIEDLKDALAEANNASSSATLKSFLIEETKEVAEIANLSQNKPNPFSASTTIEMVVPSTVANAVLYIYDLQGKQVKAITVAGRGATSETIYGNELQAGLYIYSLVTDGKLVGSKQMVLTE